MFQYVINLLNSSKLKNLDQSSPMFQKIITYNLDWKEISKNTIWIRKLFSRLTSWMLSTWLQDYPRSFE